MVSGLCFWRIKDIKNYKKQDLSLVSINILRIKGFLGLRKNVRIIIDFYIYPYYNLLMNHNIINKKYYTVDKINYI